jgi:hypothetical protein
MPEGKVNNGKIYQPFFGKSSRFQPSSNITLRTAQPNLPIAHEDNGRDAVECNHAQVSNGHILQNIFLYILILLI